MIYTVVLRYKDCFHPFFNLGLHKIINQENNDSQLIQNKREKRHRKRNLNKSLSRSRSYNKFFKCTVDLISFGPASDDDKSVSS